MEAYVGETNSLSKLASINLKAHLNQHRRPSSSENQADSAIFEHTKTSGHHIDTEDVIILDRSGGTVVRARSSRCHLGVSGEKSTWGRQISVVTRFGQSTDQYCLPIDTWPVISINMINQYH